MEIFLWIVLYLAFILPVAKCVTLEASRGYENLEFRVSSYIVFGIIWPIAVISIPASALIELIVIPICEKLTRLVED